jgi:HK97 family phage major capsid protein
MTQEEKEFLEANKTQTAELVLEIKKEFDSKLDTIRKEFKGSDEQFAEISKQLKSNQETLIAQGLEIAQSKQSITESSINTFKEAYTKNVDAFKGIANGSYGGKINFDIGANKASADMSLSNITAATGFINSFDPEVGRFVRRRPFLKDIVRRSTTDSQYIEWMDQASADGAVTTVAESAAKPKIDFDLTPRTAKVEVIAGYVTTSKQSLADYGQMRALIDDELRENVELLLDVNILTGNGTTPNLKGIQPYATAYSNTGFAALVDNASESDLWNVMAAQIATANGMGTHILMNPLDVAKFRSLRKDTTGSTTYAWWLGANMSYMGMPIIENNGVTANTCYVIDANVCRLAMREEFNITMGLDGNNFTKNQVTILGELRAVHYVKENDKPKLVYCSGITAALAALEKP